MEPKKVVEVDSNVQTPNKSMYNDYQSNAPI